MNIRLLLVLAIGATFTGCATYNTEDAARYRLVHQNLPVAVNVVDKIDRSKRRYKRLPAEAQALIDTSVANVDDALRNYLASQGIESTTEPAARSLDVTIVRAFASYGPIGTVAYPVMQIEAEFTLTTESGEVASGKINTFERNKTDSNALAAAFAEQLVNDALLKWHPAPASLEVESEYGKAIGHALLPMTSTEDDEPLPIDEPVVLSWEPMPSDRLLAASGLTEADISDVRYELRVAPLFVKNPNLSFLQGESPVIETREPWFNLGDKLPWCGRITWSVRAHFNLNGHPRVTEWSRRGGYVYAGQGFISSVGTGDGFDCYSGFLGTPTGIAASEAADEPVQLEPLQSGQGIASIVLTGSRCTTDQDACSEDSYKKNNRVLRRKLENAIDDLGKGVDVHDGVDLIDDSWFAEGNQGYQLTAGDLYAWLADETNRTALLERGVQRVLAIHSSEIERRGPRIDTSEGFEIGFHIGSKTNTSLAMLADIIDVESGEQIAQLDVTAQGSESAGLAMVLIIPIPYAVDNDAFEEGVEEIAKISSYALMGARIGWPAEFGASQK